MKASVYLETSVVSYLTARVSRDVVMAGHQASTVEWWDNHRRKFDLLISRLVLDEASEGDPEAVKRRLKILKPLRLLQIKKEAAGLAKALVHDGGFPQNAEDDAMHVALATTHGMDFLLTWNFTHIANAATEATVRQTCEEQGFHLPVICTPDELMQI
ncbi:MAG: DNA-binding protein [Verrucomicrobia bacterium]|nr:MAG: DNA-binding protein [Verrucomicrobiota bacterium]